MRLKALVGTASKVLVPYFGGWTVLPLVASPVRARADGRIENMRGLSHNVDRDEFGSVMDEVMRLRATGIPTTDIVEALDIMRRIGG